MYVVSHDALSVELADAIPGAIVVRRVRIADLARVVAKEIEVVATPHDVTSPRAGVWLEPGFELPDGNGWLEVSHDNGIDFRGFIPATAASAFWDEPATSARWNKDATASFIVRSAPDERAPQVAWVAGGLPARFATDAPTFGWARFEARAYGLRVVGWVDREPPQHNALARTYDFADATIESEFPKPFPPVIVRPPLDTCLRASPRDDATALGLVTGELVAYATDAPGWIRVSLVTAFGRLDAYVRAPEPAGQPSR